MSQTLFRSKAKAPVHALDARHAGRGGSRFFNDRRQLNASNDRDALRQIQTLLQASMQGQNVFASEDEDVDTQELTAAEATDVLRLCFAVYEAGATRLPVDPRGVTGTAIAPSGGKHARGVSR